jgi:hypothetical protein
LIGQDFATVVIVSFAGLNCLNIIIIGLFAQKKRKTVSYLQDINKIKSARRPQEA